jgi:hypothetical protein
MPRPIISSILLLATILLPGCGGSDGEKKLPVSGKVSTKVGKPCDNALIVFHPQDANRLNGPKPFAMSDSQGNFKLTTEAEGDGAVAGKYGVTIVWQGQGRASKLVLSGEGNGGGTDKLNGKYANPNRPLFSFEVKEGATNQFELTVE